MADDCPAYYTKPCLSQQAALSPRHFHPDPRRGQHESPSGGAAVGPFDEVLGREVDKHDFKVLLVVVDLEDHRARVAFATGKVQVSVIAGGTLNRGWWP